MEAKIIAILIAAIGIAISLYAVNKLRFNWRNADNWILCIGGLTAAYIALRAASP